MNEPEYVAALSRIPVTREQLYAFVRANRQENSDTSAEGVEIHRFRFELLRADPVMNVDAAIRLRALATINVPRDLRAAFFNRGESAFWNAVATVPLVFHEGIVVLDEGALKEALDSA